MGRKAGIISIDLVAGTAQFQADMERAKAKVREFGTHSVSGVQAASGAIRTIEGNVQNNVRAVERFLVTTLKLGPVLQAAFPIVGAVAFGGMIFKIGEEVVEFFRKMEQAPQRIANAFRELNAPLRTANDEMRVANDRLLNDIAKLEGKRPNTLKLILDEAIVAADKLAQSLEKDISALNKLLKEENVAGWKALLGKAPTSDITKEFGGATGTGGFFGAVAQANDEGNAKIRAAVDLKAKDAAQTALNTRLLKLYSDELAKVAGWLKTSEGLQKQFLHPVLQLPGVGGANPPHTDQNLLSDQTARIELLRGVVRNLNAEMASIGLNAANSALTEKKSGLESDHPGVEELKRLRNQLAEARANELKGFEKIAAEENAELARIKEMRLSTQQLAEAKNLVAEVFDAKRLTYFWEEYEKLGKTTMEMADHMERLQIEAHKMADAFGEHVFGDQIREGKKQIEETAKALTKVVEEYGKLARQGTSDQRGHDIRMIGLNNPGANPVDVLAAQQDIQKQEIEERYTAALQVATSEWERQVATRQRAVDLQRLDFELEEKKAEQRQRGVRDFFVEMQRNAQTAGNILYSAMHSALDRTSDELAKLFTGQRTNFRGLVAGIGQELARDSVKSGLQRGLGALGSALGIKGPQAKPDGSSADRALWVRFANPVGALPGGGTMGTTAGGNIGRIFGGSAGGGIFNLLGGLLKPFGGGRASGGMVSADQAYVVGEHGAELLYGASGRIANHSESMRSFGSGGDQHYYSIDARGTDPALVEERVVRAIQRAHDSAVSTSVRATLQRTQRVPPGR